ncbi:MAG: permease-like cell division protein FtsX [Oscillospiraceae bacterium]|nr:permease-like cell division protein FtsX [Oscillospiraceae bacterium]MBQ5712250.1 permease-like cell division protein FtsX [Oscillospiraceae bacterium]
MKINNIGYLLLEGIRGIFLHGFMSFAAVVVTVACLLIVGSFSILVYNVNMVVDRLNKTNEVMVYIDEELSLAEAQQIHTRINLLDNVHIAEFKTREQALEEFVADHNGDPAFSGLQAEDLRHRVVVKLEDNALMEQTAKELEALEGVAKITAPYEMAEGFSTLKNVLQIASVAVIGVLLVVSLLIISNTVKLAMYDRKDEIAIMKMVGATNGFIRLPFVVQGFVLGMVGAGVAFGLEWVLYDFLVEKIAELDTLKMFQLVPFQELLIPMLLTFGAAGLFVGVLGSWTSIRKFMNASAR